MLLVTSSAGPVGAAELSPVVDADAIADAVLDRMDRKADPCVDAFRWACGGWMDKAEIKPSQTRAGPYFTDVRERVEAGLDRVLSSAKESETPAGTLYTACMRAVNATDKGSAATKAGMTMLRRFAPTLAAISTDGSMTAVLAALATLHSNGGGSPLVEWGVSNSRVKYPEMVLKAYTPTLGMSRSGFRAEDPIARDINAAYRRMLSELAKIAGKAGLFPIGPDAKKAGGWLKAADAAAAVYSFEERIQEWKKAGYDAHRRAKDQPRYNFLEVAKHPDIKLVGDLLDAWGVTPPAGKAIVKYPVYFREASAWLKSAVVDDATGDGRRTLRAYLAVTATRSLAAADVLGPDAAAAYWRYRQEVKGTSAPPEATTRCVKRVGNLLPWGVGDAFVRHFFDGADKKKAAKDLVDAIREVYPSLFDDAAWLDARTRAAAKAKFAALAQNVVSFPRNPTDFYDDVVVSVDDYAGSWMSAARHAWRVDWERLRAPRAEREPHMASWETNAQHSSSRNEITIPAGLLQTPFFDLAAPAALTYGSAGHIVGHEISHAFDNNGHRYNARGEWDNWWSDAAAAAYKSKTKCFVKLFDSYVVPGVGANVTVDGQLTLPENLADAGGLAAAAIAWDKAVAAGKTGPANPRLNAAFTPKQLFFLGYAQTYCRKRTVRSMLDRLSNNRHSPGQFRLQGGLSQHPGFAAAFSCAPGTPYNPPKRCSLW
ncbi:hypothetical protein MMPV_002929 [Pyropia vietnamensis]